MKLANSMGAGLAVLALGILGISMACKGSSGGGDGAKPAPKPADASSRARLQTEPRAATLITEGSLHLTSVGIKRGAQFEEIEALTGRHGLSIKREPQGSGSFSWTSSRGAKPVRVYQAQGAPGLCHLSLAVSTGLSTKVEVTVVHPPVGLPAVLEQRSVTVGVGKTVAFSVKAEPAAGDPQTFTLGVEEQGGGTLETSSLSWAKLGLYKAPATPGVYHVKLTSPTNPAVSDRAEIKVVADS